MGGRPDDIQARVERVRSRIRRAASQAGRSEGDVLLLAVTKTHPPETISSAHAAGVRHFGENRVEEAEGKIAALSGLDGVTWHMVGHLQSRKAALAANLFSWIHSVDRVKAASKLNDAASANGSTIQALLEVNLSGEETKSGFMLSGWPGNDVQETYFFRAVEAVAQLPAIDMCGLMTIPPNNIDPEKSREVFARLRSLRGRLSNVFPTINWTHLSMGMSADFDVAIQEGATIVRLGTIIFGARTAN